MNIVGSVVKEDLTDLEALKEYATLVAKKRASKNKEWDTFYKGVQPPWGVSFWLRKLR